MILIYSKSISPRLKYSFDLVFQQILRQTIEITTDKVIFENAQTPKVNYSDTPISDELFFKNTSILFENNIRTQKIDIKSWKNYKIFFFHAHKSSILPFDPFAMIFYLVSRYEEYLPSERDQHDRFQAKNSLAFQHDFLEEPLVNQLVIVLQNILQKKYPSLEFPKPYFSITPTYDIDYAWSYQYKGWKRTLGGAMRDLVQQPRLFLQRLEVALLGKTDPYFTFDFLEAYHEKIAKTPIYFFLVGEYGDYDKNISIQQPAFRQLIRQLERQNIVGIHPSYQSNFDRNTLIQEKMSLEEVTNNRVIYSRQHFLKLKFPETYHKLLEIGIQTDCTMGYADQVGFRASICTPFKWFDLSRNVVTELSIKPFEVMDVTLKNYMQLSPEEAIEKISDIKNSIKKVGGDFCYIFHNNSLCEQEGWEGWRKVLLSMV